MIPTLVSARMFKELSGQRNAGRTTRRDASTLLGVRKELVEPVEKVDDRTLRFVISTGAVDRDLDVINQDGWRLDNYTKNPLVLWAHNATMPPIGKAIDFAVNAGRLASTVRFLPPDEYGTASAWADQIYKLARDGWLSATSVGFRPIKWDFTDDPERGADDWWPGIDYFEAELVEFSLVCVPANPEALIEDPLTAEAPVHAAYDRARRARIATANQNFARAGIGPIRSKG